MKDAGGATLLRSGGVADLASVNDVISAAFDPRYGEAWTASQCAGMMALPGVWLTIADRNGAAAGFAMSRAILDDGELLLLAVDPALRRAGIGKSLLRAVIAEARSRGVEKLHLEVRAGNPALALYRGEGFAKIGERRDYYRGIDGRTYDAQTFQREINE